MTYYSISDLTVCIDSGPVILQKELEDFQIDEPNGKSDIYITLDFSRNDLKDRFNFRKHDSTWIIASPLLNVIENKDSYLIRYRERKLVYGYEVFKNSNSAVIFINPDEIPDADTYDVKLFEHEIEDTTGPELLLYSIRDAFFFQALKFGRIAVHSSSIIYKNKTFLFSAPSGVGKTTHINQWDAANIDHQIFNGDVCMCYLKDGIPYAGGLPWSGTSESYTNKNIPLGGVTFLKQGCNNEIRQLKLSDAALNLIARCLSPNWNRALVSNSMDIVEALVPNIISAALSCNISPEAALTVQDFLEDKI